MRLPAPRKTLRSIAFIDSGQYTRRFYTKMWQALGHIREVAERSSSARPRRGAGPVDCADQEPVAAEPALAWLSTARGRSRCTTVGMFAVRSGTPLSTEASRQALDLLRPASQNSPNNPSGTRFRVSYRAHEVLTAEGSQGKLV